MSDFELFQFIYDASGNSIISRAIVQSVQMNATIDVLIEMRIADFTETSNRYD